MFFLFRNPKTAKELSDICKTPLKLGIWIKLRLRYRADMINHGRGYVQAPQETLTGILRDGNKIPPRTGDCEDYAVLAYESLKHMNIESSLICISYPKDNSLYSLHMICIFRYGGRLYTIDNQKGYCSFDRTETVKDVVKVFARNYYDYLEYDYVFGKLLPKLKDNIE